MNLTRRSLAGKLIAGITALAFCACGGKQAATTSAKSAPRSKVLEAKAIVVTPSQFNDDFATTGTLLPEEEVSVMPEMQGRIVSINFKEGAHVNKGQVLATLYNEDVKAQIQKLKAQRSLQDKILERQEQLLKIGGISRQDYETTLTQIKSIDADIAYSEAQLRKTTIVAPFSGTAGIRNISPGAVVTTSTAITTLQQTDRLKLDFNMPEQYRDEMRSGKKVHFTVTSRLDTFEAEVWAVEPVANSDTRSLRVRAIVPSTTHMPVPGSFAHVIVPLDQNKGALMIPTQSVIPTNRDKVVAVIRGGKAALVPVILGARTSDKVEIVKGIAAGDTVLTTGIMQVKPGLEVKAQVEM